MASRITFFVFAAFALIGLVFTVAGICTGGLAADFAPLTSGVTLLCGTVAYVSFVNLRAH